MLKSTVNLNKTS